MNCGAIVMPTMLSGIEEESDMYEVFPSHVDTTGITLNVDSPPPKKTPLKTLADVQGLLQQNKKREVKLMLRENAWPVNSPIRKSLWPLLCGQHQHGKSMSMGDGFYWDMVTQVFGSTDLPDKQVMLPPFVESSHCLSYNLTRKGRGVADRVVCVLGYACPDITYSPSLYPICAILLHFMSEEECYHCMTSLVAAKEKTFITQTKLLYEVTWKTVMQIAKKHVKGAAAHLARHCQDNKMERIYVDWLWWILQGLPFNHLVRVMDCFFHEGIKVLYRIAMAILILFHKSSSSGNSEWNSEILKNGVDSALNKFCRQMPMSPSKVLRTAFNIRGLSSAYISRVFIRTEMVLKSRSVLNTGPRQLARSRSSENLPTSQSQVNIQMMSHTLTIREYEFCFAAIVGKGAHSPEPRALSMGMYPVQSIKSKIVDSDDEANNLFRDFYQRFCSILTITGALEPLKLLTLWSWLPLRITMYQPILLYTTEEHGCSLTTFYVRVEQHEPTLLMIKTCNNEVFGAYCSTRWYERNLKDDRGQRQAYFGTGETFLFSLYPERTKYPWVGMNGDQHLGHGCELFMAADSKMITIGGGEGQAIWMDENIRFGKTDRCTTFNNPPLCPSGDFEIRVLEVYGFHGA